MDIRKDERFKAIIHNFMEQWGEVQPTVVPPITTEIVDSVSPIIQAMDYFNKLLLQDNEEGHLNSDANEALNDAIAELARTIVRDVSMPRFIMQQNINHI